MTAQVTPAERDQRTAATEHAPAGPSSVRRVIVRLGVGLLTLALLAANVAVVLGLLALSEAQEQRAALEEERSVAALGTVRDVLEDGVGQLGAAAEGGAPAALLTGLDQARSTLREIELPEGGAPQTASAVESLDGFLNAAAVAAAVPVLEFDGEDEAGLVGAWEEAERRLRSAYGGLPDADEPDWQAVEPAPAAFARFRAGAAGEERQRLADSQARAEQQTARQADIEIYRRSMTAVFARYEELRTALADFDSQSRVIDSSSSASTFENFFEDAGEARYRIAAQLEAIDAPAGLDQVHRSFVTTLNDLGDAVSQAANAADEAYCFSARDVCPTVAGTRTYQQFGDRAAILRSRYEGLLVSFEQGYQAELIDAYGLGGS